MPNSIVGIGVDCEGISRFKKISSNFIRKTFTKKEISYCTSQSNPYQHYAARFAAKESVIKALSNLGIKVFFNKIEIFHDKNKVPRVKLIKSKINQQFDIYLSLTHAGDMAIAFVIITKAGKNGSRRKIKGNLFEGIQ